MSNLKSVFIGLMMFSFVAMCNGQTEAGKFLIGGESSLGLSSTKTKLKTNASNDYYYDNDIDGPKTFSLDFSPSVGYFVVKNFAVGLEIPIEYTSQKYEENGSAKITNVAIAPFLKYYIGSGNIKPFFEGAFGFGSMHSIQDSPYDSEDVDTKANVSLIGLQAGISIFPNKNVSFDIGASYSSATIKPKDSGNNLKTITSGIGLKVGINFHL